MSVGIIRLIFPAPRNNTRSFSWIAASISCLIVQKSGSSGVYDIENDGLYVLRVCANCLLVTPGMGVSLAA